MQYQQQHFELLGQKAVRALATGSSAAAVPLLQELGMPASGIIDTEDGGKAIEMQNGEIMAISPQLMMSLAAPGAKLADMYSNILRFQTTAEGQRLRAEATVKASENRLRGTMYTADQRSKDWQKRFVDNNGNQPMKAKEHQYLTKLLIDEGLPPDVAAKQAGEQIWHGKNMSMSASQKQAAIEKQLKNIPATIRYAEPGSAEYASDGHKYYEWLQKHAQGGLGYGAPAGNTQKLGPSGATGGYEFGDLSTDGKHKLVRGKGWVPVGS